MLTFGMTAFVVSKYIIVLAIIAVLFFVFLGAPMIVSGQSMESTFRSEEIVLVQRVSYQISSIKRGDVVAARFPADPNRTRLIKRVIGLPGETLELDYNTWKVNGVPLEENIDLILGEPPYQQIEKITLKAGQYFLIGDNRPGSSDSRLWGPVEKDDIIGRVDFIVFPIGRLQFIYNNYR